MNLRKVKVIGIIALFAILSALPAIANTQGIRGINWADSRNNFQTGWVLPSGMSSGMSNSAAYSLGQHVALACKNIGGNTVRMPVNPPTVSNSGNNWSNYQQAINGVLSEGVKVILCYWIENGGGTIYNTSEWDSMWSTINSAYGSNGNVMYEPINEPFSYSASSLASIYNTFQSTYSSKGNWEILYDGTDYAQYLNGICTDSNLNNEYMAIHIYQNWDNVANNEDWQDYTTALNTAIDGAQSRTVVTEFGANCTDGTNYYGNSADGLSAEIEYVTGVTNYMNSNGMGGTYWAGVKDGDDYRLFDSSSDVDSGNYALTNSSMEEQVKWCWGQG